MVGEALIKQGYKLFNFKIENTTLEADFFIRSTASLIPVEAKAKSGREKVNENIDYLWSLPGYQIRD